MTVVRRPYDDPVRNLDWFQVTEIRGHLLDGQIADWQVSLKVGFRPKTVSQQILRQQQQSELKEFGDEVLPWLRERACDTDSAVHIL